MEYQITRKTAMTRKLKNQKCSHSRGSAMLRVMLSVGIVSMMALFDAERHKNNLVGLQRKLASRSMSSFKSSLSNWLQSDGSIAHSFGNDVPIASGRSQVQVYRWPNALPALLPPPAGEQGDRYTSPSFNNPETRQTAATDTDSIRHIVIPPTPPIPAQVKLRPGTGGKSDLLGIPNGANIKGLDGQSGWVYIRSMWIENFDYHKTVLLQDKNDPTQTEEYWSGNADLKIVIWKFNNRIDSPGLDCDTENNCTRHVYTAKLEIQIDPDNGRIQQGWFGLDCRRVETRTITTGATLSNRRCEDSRFFNKIRGINTSGLPGDLAVVGEYEGRCCKPALIEP